MEHTNVAIVLESYEGRTFGFKASHIDLNIPVPKKGEFRRDMILKLKVSDHVIDIIKEMEEVKKNSLGIGKSIIRRVRE